MASRKQQKEQARVQRLEQERQLAAKTARNRRYYLFGGVIAAAIVVIVVAIVVSSGGSSPATGLQHNSGKTYATVNHLLSGIPQSGTTLGDPKAPVTMTYFGDLQCPICKDFTLNDFPQFVKDQVRTGKVKVNYRSSCTASCNNTSFSNPQSVFQTQQVAAYAAGKQNLFWDYTDLFYHEQGAEGTDYVNEHYLNGLAAQIPKLKLSRWSTDRGDPSLLSQVQADEQAAASQAPNGTPTLIMSGPKGTETVQGSNGGVPNYNNLAAAVAAVQ